MKVEDGQVLGIPVISTVVCASCAIRIDISKEKFFAVSSPRIIVHNLRKNDRAPAREGNIEGGKMNAFCSGQCVGVHFDKLARELEESIVKSW